MNKIKKILKCVAVWLSSATAGIMAIFMLTGAFRFAIAFFENRNPDSLECISIIFVASILGCIGASVFYCEEYDEQLAYEVQKECGEVE